MTKKAKVWLIVAVVLVVAGSIFFVGVMSMFKWDFKKLSTVEYVSNTYEITDDFSNILFDTDTADIEFIESSDGKTTVECYEYKNMLHTVSVVDNTLTVMVTDTRKWYEHIGINIGTPKITVYMPKGEYADLTVNATTGDVKIARDFKFGNAQIKISTGDIGFSATVTNNLNLKTTTGDMQLNGVFAKQIDLSLTTGVIKLNNIECDNLVSNGTTGDAKLSNVKADQKLFIKRSTGDIFLDGCDAGEIFIKATTGDVKGSLLSDKVFVTKATTGDITVPNTTTGGKCEIKVTTGDIKIEIAK
jgi:DUF4097 and DUF4098 domain-containing protein YvlB